MADPKEQYKYWRGIFRRIMTRYDSTKSTYTNSGAINYERMGSGGGGFNPRVVRPLPVDFVSDVELAARYALRDDVPALRMFVKVYMEKYQYKPQVKEMSDFKAIKERVQWKVGRELERRHIHPLHEYAQAKDCR